MANNENQNATSIPKPLRKQDMNKRARDRVLAVASGHGFEPELNSDRNDLYVKLIMLKSPKLPFAVYIDKVAGMDSSGEPESFKVCMHPQQFDQSATGLVDVTAAINMKTKKNRFKHSGFSDCPDSEEGGEPNAKCYRVESWEGLDSLLKQLPSAAGMKTGAFK